MGRLARSRYLLRLFTPEQWRTLQRMQRLVKAHPQAEAEMRRFSQAAFERGLVRIDPETFPDFAWDPQMME